MLAASRIKPRLYAFPNDGQKVIITRRALHTFSQFRQIGQEPEAGGLLFARFHCGSVQIASASLPSHDDGRWRTLFVPNRQKQRTLIREQFKKGLHFVGEWHTHPQKTPSPSGLDLKSAEESFTNSRHELNYFLMIIVGNQMDDLSLWVSAHDNHENIQLRQTR